ncbi:TniQ family protein [Saccharomonospora marina]|uniref:hypothetical protein n=1 Tax=Saccharomonospora marina TaxID=632569 RepID=UPI0012F8D938
MPGEPFGLWWHTYAVRLDVTRTTLAHAAGIPAGAQPGPEHAPGIACLAGLSVSEVTAMFAATRPCPPEHVLRVWTPQPASRFCPDCLGEGTCWQPAWAIPLTFHCLRHNAPLAERCPACWQPQLQRIAPGGVGTNRLSCSSCGHNLTTGHARPLDTCGGDAAGTQRLLATLLTRTRDPALTGQDRERAADDLTDLTLIALHLSQDQVSKRGGFTRQLPAAAALIEATTLLATPRGTRDPVPELVTRCCQGPRSRAIPFSWQTASPALITRIARGRDMTLTPIERIRYATTLPEPAPRPRQATDPALTRAARLPDQLWPAWAIRLADDDNVDGPVFRSAMIAALLLPHSQLQLNELTSLLPHQPRTKQVGHQLRRLGTTSGDSRALRILTELGLALDHHDIPIDYARRRRLVGNTELIDKPTWDRYCHDAGLHVGRQRRLDLARRYLYELLTGGNLATAPQPYRLDNGAPRIDHIEFCASMPVRLVTTLAAHAEQLLHAAGITAEPLSWQPPTGWVSVTRWPGADPDRTDPRPIHDALRAQWGATSHNHWAPTQVVAESLGISSHHLRHVLRRHPIAEAPYPRHRAGAIIPMPANDRETGYRAEPGRTDPQRIFLVDLSWLREQYTTWNRSITHIATEIGCRPATLRAFAETHHIPRRPRGGSRDHIATGTIIGHPANLPGLLRKALRGQQAHHRIERFLLMTECSSLTQLALARRIHQSSLTTGLKVLERNCGGPLFHRRPHPQPLGLLTPLGEQLCRQARDYLARSTRPRHEVTTTIHGRSHINAPIATATTSK